VIVKHYWRKQVLKDSDLLGEAVVFSIFVNTLAYYLIEEEPEMYARIIEDAKKKVTGYLGVKRC